MFRWIIVNYSLKFEVNYPFDKENTEVSGLSILRMCCACLGERLFVRSLYSAARRVLLSRSTLDPIGRHHLDREDLESNLRSLPTELAEVRAEVKITISKGKCARLLDVF